MVNTFLVDLFREYKRYKYLATALVGEQASSEQCETAAYIFKVYSHSQHTKFFPTDSDAAIGSANELMNPTTNRRAVDMSAALTDALQFFAGQKSYTKKVLFVLSTSLHIPCDVADRMKALGVDVIVLSRIQNPIQQTLLTRAPSFYGQYIYVDAQQYHYLKQFASQETAQLELVRGLTTSTSLVLSITGCEAARDFKVQMSEERSVVWHTIGVTGRTFKVEGLVPGNTYCVRVKATGSDEWLSEYSDLFRFTLPAATDITPLIRQSKSKSELVKQYKKYQKDLTSLPGKRVTLIVQGNRREDFIRALKDRLPKSDKSFKVCFAATQGETVGTYYPVLAIDPSCNVDALLSQFSAIERVPWPLHVVLFVNTRTVRAISEEFINRLCCDLRITRDAIVVVQEEDSTQELLPFELVVNIMSVLANENPDLFSFEKERGTIWNNSFVSLWELFDKSQQGEELPAEIKALFKSIMWHPPF